MRNWARYSVAGVLAVAATLGLRGLSHLPFAAERDPRAVVRLSWRVVGQQIRECRRLSPEELGQLPAHLRREEVCEGRVAPYRLHVLVDGTVADSGLVRAAGARQDRPIYVFREISIEPGAHRLEISFVSESPPGLSVEGPVAEGLAAADSGVVGPDSSGARPGSTAVPLAGAAGGTARTAEAAPVELHLDTRLTLKPREIALVVYDPVRRELVLEERKSDRTDAEDR